MVNKLLKLKWFLFGLPDYPPRSFEVLAYKSVYNNGEPFFTRGQEVSKKYLAGAEPEQLAKELNVTRERVRQILWKDWRRADRWKAE